jgi:MFS family permease
MSSDDTRREDRNGDGPLDSAAVDRLRDRTDELELIISSLTIFALFSLPGWLFDKFADIYTHLSTSFVIAGMLAVSLLAGFSYGLAACFVVHLMARAYWVGLIGLRTAFPGGIRWDRTLIFGPIGREHFRRALPDLDQVIASTDRLASSLFAVISMLTLGALWFGTLMITTLVAAGAIGASFGRTNTALVTASLVLVVAFVGVPLLSYLLDAQLASRLPRLQRSPTFAALIGAMRRFSGLAYPRRLVLPVQLTLQSNTRPLAFFVALTLGTVVIVSLGNTRLAAWQNFTLSSEFTYLDTPAVQRGFRSTYYEDMPSSMDRLRGWPRVSSFVQGGSVVRLFLPYQPLRDNLVLDQICPATARQDDPASCLRQLWSVRIRDRIVPMDGFVGAERADIGMRGLIGLIPTSGLKPGMHTIHVRWNAGEITDIQALDDRYSEASNEFTIPIAFAPDYELALD